MTYLKKTENFNPRFEVVSALLYKGDKVVFLHRLPTKSQGDKWGLPAGKVERNESYLDAIIREIQEETGYTFNDDYELEENYKVFYVVYPDYQFTFIIFKGNLNVGKEPVLQPNEHAAFNWKVPNKAFKDLLLVDDLQDCLELYFS